MLAFGTFIVALIALIVELIKSQQKKGSIIFGTDRKIFSQYQFCFMMMNLHFKCNTKTK
ncbi:putative holin-like toxin [Lactiplantibacillus plantarum]|uniref:putative holin-like toxin n=1 Tax=Lactiplantibacillus plantarum TaxID=1590 RepID=UPI0021A946D2